MNNTFRIFSTLLLLIVISNIYGQNSRIVVNDKYVAEKIVLNTDRDLYFSGEEIFFSAEYFINNKKASPIISNIIYLELINCNNNSTHIQKKYKLSDYNANGILNIPDDLATGNYMLRAYTQYQRNFSSLDYSYHFLTILNPKNYLTPIKNWQETDSILIVPEGGIILDNIKNNIVIRIPDSLLVKENTYCIADESLNVIETIEPLTNGFALAEMNFNNSHKYNLVIKNSIGEELIKPFPEVQNIGIQTNVQLFDTDFNYVIQTKGLNSDSKNLGYQIKVVSNSYNVNYSKDITLNNSLFNVSISKNILSSGINYIVLIGPNGEIEKINSIYNSFKDFQKIKIEIDKEYYNPQEKIRARISTNIDKNDEIQVAIATVTKQGAKQGDRNFIPSYYLNHPLLLQDYMNNLDQVDFKLQSQIMILFDETLDKKSFRERFKKNDPSQTLDYVPEIRDLSISGILRNKTTNEPIANQDIYVSVLYNNPQLHVFRSRENGEFIFSLNNLYGINDLFLCSSAATENNPEILIKSSFSNDIPSFNELPLLIDYSEKKLIEDIYFNSQVQKKICKKGEVIEGKNRVKSLSFNIDDNKTTVILDNYIKLETFKDLFIELIPNASLKKVDGHYAFNIYDKNSYLLPGNPLVLVDNIPVFDVDKIMELHVAQIEKIDVISKTYLLGANSINGIIMITTNTENFGEIELSKSGTFIEYQTLEKPVSVDNINSDCVKSSTSIPDFRTTLFWDPKFKLAEKESIIDFNASDSKGIYDIIVKGYTSTGQIIYGKKQITID